MLRISLIAGLCLGLASSAFAHDEMDTIYFVQAKAKNQRERSRVVALGIAIDGVLSDSITFLASSEELAEVKKLGLALEVTEMPDTREWGTSGFPRSDQDFHDYKGTLAVLDGLASTYPDLAQRVSLGTSLEGRDLAGIRLSSNPKADSLPTAIFTGCHHAREHLSVEMPLKLAQYLASNYASNARVKDLLDHREVWIVPMVNPDGAEYDISTGRYKSWRKNRRDNADGSYGVDLNRNYGGAGFGGAGSSGRKNSDIYRGPSAFSEPETAAMRDFVRARKRTTVLLTYHTFGEVIMWPWGYTNDDIVDKKDLAVFETMGKAMAKSNGYKAEKSSDSYLSGGETTDWAYEELKIFGYTFELSPSSLRAGGFYPGAKAINPTFKANLEPALYLIDKAEDPYSVTVGP